MRPLIPKRNLSLRWIPLFSKTKSNVIKPSAVADDKIQIANNDLKEVVERLPSQLNLKEDSDVSFIEGVVSEQFNRDLLTFSELPSKRETDDLIAYLGQISNHFSSAKRNDSDDKILFLKDPDNKDVHQINTNYQSEVLFNRSNITKAAELGLFGLSGPSLYGGLQLPPFGMTAVLETIGSHSVPFGCLIGMHNLWIVRSLSWYGTKNQQEMFMKSLVNAQTTGTLLTFGRYKNLEEMNDRNYEKNTANQSSLIIRSAPSNELMKSRKSNEGVCFNAFIGIDGIPCDVVLSTMSSIPHLVSFSSTMKLCDLDYIGLKPLRFGILTQQIDENSRKLKATSNQIMVEIINSDSYQFLAVASGALKGYIGQITKLVCSQDRFGRPMCSLDAVQSVLGEVQITSYVIQSLVYYISSIGHAANGRIDRSIESSLAVLFGFDVLIDGLERLCCVSPFEMSVKIKENIANIKTMAYAVAQAADMDHVRDNTLANIHRIIYSSAAKRIVLKMKRKPKAMSWHAALTNIKSQVIWSMAQIEGGRSSSEWLKSAGQLPYRLFEMVHPSLEQAAMMLEYTSHKLDVASKFMELGSCPPEWFLKSAFDVLCMAACISRASRSYCIGLINADDERIMTNAFCHQRMKSIQKTFEQCCYSDHTRIIFTPKKPFDVFAGGSVPQHPYDMS